MHWCYEDRPVRDRMSYASAIYLVDARVTLVSALAWRVIAELFRRYQRRFDLRISQVHPGISVRGALVLKVGGQNGEPLPRLSLNLGGPSGTYSVDRRIDGRAAETRVPTYVEFAGPMLREDPSKVIDQIASAWALPDAPGQLPPSNATTLSVRTIAGLLERLVFRTDAWRTTAGICANDAVGSMIPDWLAALGVDDRTARHAVADSSSKAADFLTRFVLVHRTDCDSTCLRLADLRGTGWAFDVATGTAFELTSLGRTRTIDLASRYRQQKRDLQLVVGDLETSLT